MHRSAEDCPLSTLARGNAARASSVSRRCPIRANAARQNKSFVSAIACVERTEVSGVIAPNIFETPKR
jgi:hypothetical protein